ncbi:hypothetical protein B0T10DRAFT_211601 [Thelonectria olida]|uniref:Secreted protein n=1 Tax=Thelonectria olida TaxID=1576542 RepID=A0A9P9ASY6_9HYPO|nr:hypothetical protein B0T10DRAFT_211601 [Thelonectria olida]
MNGCRLLAGAVVAIVAASHDIITHPATPLHPIQLAHMADSPTGCPRQHHVSATYTRRSTYKYEAIAGPSSSSSSSPRIPPRTRKSLHLLSRRELPSLAWFHHFRPPIQEQSDPA